MIKMQWLIQLKELLLVTDGQQALLVSVGVWQSLQNPKLSDPCSIYASADDTGVISGFVINYFIAVI